MKNRINVFGVISPSDWDWEREFVSEYAATFPVQVAEALATADPCRDLELHIDSPGGYIDAGRSMISMIEDWCEANGRVCNVTVGGMAASMAAVMMVAFKGSITVHECSMVMFHAAKTSIWNDATAEELRDAASSLETFNAYAAKVIARRAGISESEAAALIEGRKESFYSAKDLVDAKLADVIQGEASVEPVRLPSAKAIRNLAHKFPANDVGGLLAAVAVAAFGDRQTTKEGSMPKKKKMTASAESTAEPVVVDCAEETATAVVDETAPAPVDQVEETPAEEAKADAVTDEVDTPAETTEPAEDPAPAQEQEAAPEEETTEAETPAADEPEESDEVKALRDELARAQAAEKAAIARAESAESALAAAKKSVVSAALTPPPVAAIPEGKNAFVAWREAVRACGNNTAVAKQKHPELFAALSK